MISSDRSKSAVVLAVSSLCLACAITSGSLHGQTNNFSFQLEIVPDDPAALQNIGGQGSHAISFWLRGRSRATSLAPNNFNYGVMRASVGATFQTPSFITITDSVASTRLARGVVTPIGPGGFPLTGLGPLHRGLQRITDETPSAWHSQTENGPEVAPFPNGLGPNGFGAFDLAGDRIYGFDAYAGAPRNGLTDPYAVDFPAVPVGEWSTWQNLYKFDVLLDSSQERLIQLNASALVSAGTQRRTLGGGVWVANITTTSSGSRSVSAPTLTFVVPGPTSAAVLGLAGLAAARRRRD